MDYDKAVTLFKAQWQWLAKTGSLNKYDWPGIDFESYQILFSKICW